MQESRQHIVVVADEHGGFAGIVTLEDLLEEIVGEIESEHGVPSVGPDRATDGSLHVRGDMPLRDLDRDLGTALDNESAATTIGGLLVDLAGERIPSSGEEFTTGDGTRIKVLDASPRRVRRVSVRASADADRPGGNRDRN
jgi:CBS domain containing-hemolysin-like protein